MSICSHCRGPITGSGRPGRSGAVYCTFGCLQLGEAACGLACSVPIANTAGVGVRLGVGVLVVGQSMVFGLALNLHDDVPPAARAFTQWGLLAGTALVAALLGGPLVRAAWAELRRGRLTIEALFLLTMAGALAASLQAHLTGRGKVYFEVVSVLLVVYTLGKLIGARSREAALAASRPWADQLDTCRLVEAGGTRTAPVSEVQAGDVIEVYAGESIAVDGVIRDGVGFVSEAAVSGEPGAVVRRPGDRVLAGAASFDATFRIVATAPGTARQVDRLLAAVEAARDRPLSLQSRADALGRWFLPLVVLTALGTFGYWTFLTDAGWEDGLFNAMSVLLVACPCVIGLATPVVIWSALGRLAERGVIVRGGDAVERLAEVDRVMFDKTGTLTEDRFALVDVETFAPDRATLLGWLSLVQAQSTHPIAKPFAELPRQVAPGVEPRVLSVVAVPGCGVRAGLVEANGARHTIEVGTPRWLPSRSHDARREAPGTHLVHVALDGELVAVATVAERLRDSAPLALAHFAELGLPVEVLTGDTTARADALGLPRARGALRPDDKRAAVEDAKAAGAKPLFVGDGINDASALAAAHVGAAMASGTDLAMSAAAVTLYTDDLRALPWAVELSRGAVRAVRRNLLRALAYNLVGMTLAAFGALHPVAAALLMVVSSLTLVFSSTRFEPSGGRKPPVLVARRENRGLTPPARLAALHALAFALQGVVLARLVPAFAALICAFALVGIALAIAWRRYDLSHSVDMCFGMLTFGNLGMLLGWWADNGFAPLACAHCVCADLRAPWMWLGMLLFANVAMKWFARSPAPGGCHSLAMYTSGNVGMVFGMIAGGWVAKQAAISDVALALGASFAAMTVGMLAGMLAGTWLAERLLVGLRAVGLAPRWLKFSPSRTP